jgi:lipoate-protein ligase B
MTHHDSSLEQLSTRCYVSHLETFLSTLTTSLGVPVYPLEHTGVFTSPTSKIGSIGIHIRRRISLHGFSLNVEEQTRPWFDAIVACGLEDVRSTSVEAELTRLRVEGQRAKVVDAVPIAVSEFGKQYGREMRELKEGDEWSELRRMIEDGVGGRLPPLEKKVLAMDR